MANDNSLLPHEWFAVTTLIGIIFSCIILLFLFGQADELPTIDAKGKKYHQTISVTIEGAVENPGSYTVPKGTTIGTLLEQANPLKGADLSLWKHSASLRKNQRLRIPFIDNVIVTVTGAVDEAQTLIIPRGTSIREIPHYASLSENYDHSFFSRKRRALKDFEVIDVPFQ